MHEFEKRNPNIKVFNAVMHLDEATPHLHIDFLPVCHNQKQGLPTRISMKKALEEQGFVSKSKRQSEWALWAEAEKKNMIELLKKYGFNRDVKNAHYAHMECEEYRQSKSEIEKLNKHINQLKEKPDKEFTQEEINLIKNQNDFMRSEIQKRDEKIRILAKKAGAKFVPFDVYSQEKIVFIATELERIGIPNIAESNCIYVPDYALKTCSSVATRYIPPKNSGVRSEIAFDIDRLIYSSENLDELLKNLKDKLGYEIKADGKYISVKSPKAQRFVRLKSLGDEYLPNNLEKRIADKDKFPNAVLAKAKSSSEIEQSFYTTITQTIIEVQTLRYKPSKTYSKKIYSYSNDKDINYLSEQLLTISNFNLNSKEKIYEEAEKCAKSIAEKNENINRLNAEIPTLKADIAQLKFLFSDLKNSKDTMTQMKIAAAQEKAEKYGVKSLDDIENLERRLKLIPMYVQNLKNETIEEQVRMAKIKDLISAYEKIIEGNYIDNLIAAQKEQTKIKNDKII